ncbi:cyclase family protein [Paracraurococcus ruber]|uniref:Cyclase n=1 Tax=Paracraurococcus ruber TaxID=77675 RepID=A0ABS1CTS1_9PROT|nr:cyclase family protein [Paracraurococcus ruber]MBK1657392.1 cyclase [Paracraurococcus ruber]TDG32410.1 cyclase family protein [Paracraurococcus ruber]
MRIVDLSMPIAPHFRWRTQVSITGDIAAGDQFRISRLDAACHGFSHVDAPAHILADAPTIEATPLDRVVGPCRVLDLRDAPDNRAIDADRLAAADPGGPPGEILLLSAGWDRRRDHKTPEFWREAPWLTRDAAEWLLARDPKAVAFDFPQDYPIRLLLDGQQVPFDQHVTHDVLLRRGITLIEYLVNTAALAGPRTFLCAAPLLIPGADGAPARVFALEGLPA